VAQRELRMLDPLPGQRPASRGQPLPDESGGRD